MPARVRMVLIALVLLGGSVPPVDASTGGTASATGAQAVAGEVGLAVTTDGAIGGLQPVIDRLTAEPILAGSRLTVAQATTPPEPSGTDGGTLGPASVGQVLTLAAVTAETERIEDGLLSASSGISGASIAVLGLSVLDVGAVSAVATTHPTRLPTASARVEDLEVFGSAVTLVPGEPVERSLELSSDQVLTALTDLVPALAAVTGFTGRVAGAGGRLDVRLTDEHEVDNTTGSASATALSAQVHLSLDLRLCLPELRGDGCLGEVLLQADASVLDVRLGQSRVQRPRILDTSGGPARYAEPLGVLACLLAATGVYVGYRQGRWLQTDVPAEPDRG